MPFPFPSTLVDQAAEGRENLRRAMNLVEDDQTIFVVAEKEGWFAEFLTILARLQIEVQGVSFAGDLMSQSGLAHLSGPEQGDGSLSAQGARDSVMSAPRNHPRKLNTLYSICEANRPASCLTARAQRAA